MPRMVRLIWILLALHLALGMIAYAHFLFTGQLCRARLVFFDG